MRLLNLIALTFVAFTAYAVAADESVTATTDCGFWDETCKVQRARARAEAPQREREEVQRKWREANDPNWREKEALDKMSMSERIDAINAKNQKENERRIAEQAESKRRYEESVLKRKAEEEQQRQLYEQRRQEALAQQEARTAKYEAERLADEKLEKAQAAKSTALENERKNRCASDYKNPQIGMRLARLEDCVTRIRLTSQINRADGVVSTYQGGGMWFNVMSGSVVAWGR